MAIKIAMKYITITLSILTIFGLSGCNKSSIRPTKNSTFSGKWKVIGNMISSGGPMYFVAANGKNYAEFYTDGRIGGTAFPDYRLYTIKDSVTVNMTSADKAKYENYIYKIKGDTLTLGLAGPAYCIEGCAIVLLKQ
jgi:hypothetical protein